VLLKIRSQRFAHTPTSDANTPIRGVGLAALIEIYMDEHIFPFL
jgi:hypothetical protein